jgi:hypothetical protein
MAHGRQVSGGRCRRHFEEFSVFHSYRFQVLSFGLLSGGPGLLEGCSVLVKQWLDNPFAQCVSTAAWASNLRHDLTAGENSEENLNPKSKPVMSCKDMTKISAKLHA